MPGPLSQRQAADSETPKLAAKHKEVERQAKVAKKKMEDLKAIKLASASARVEAETMSRDEEGRHKKEEEKKEERK